jgi:hypothetical protein
MNGRELTTYERWYGRDMPPSELRWLRAGPLTVALDGPDLRYLLLGDVELMRRVYVAVRDLEWNTIGDTGRDVEVTESGDTFTVTSRLRHVRSPIDFEWDGRLEGFADGTITYEMNGTCRTAFDYAKIGICVHHPSRECQGRPYRAATPDGAIDGTLPLLIGPQIYLQEEGYDAPLFDPFSSLAIVLESGITVRFEYEGSLFEIEDQRNWTDASFKAASTPAYLGYRHHGEPGKGIHQRVTIRCDLGAARRARRMSSQVLTLGSPLGLTLPPIGFGLPSDRRPHTANEAGRVRDLRPDHLRADVRLGDGAALEAALGACREVGCAIELALFVPAGSEWRLAELGSTLAASGVPVARVLLFGEGQDTTPQSLVSAAVDQLSGVALAGGTNVYFCQANRDRPDARALGGIAYSVNPQVHAFDERSLAETLDGQAETVRTARAVFGDVPVVVTPVTLRPRFNADALDDQELAVPSEHELPWEVDRRQMSMFCAAWTLGSVKALAEAGAASLTYYETTGWRGLFERDAGCPTPELFPSDPGMIFPVYGTFASLRECQSAELIGLVSSHPLEVVGLAVRRTNGLRLLIANLTDRPCTLAVEPLGVRPRLEPFGVAVVDPDSPSEHSE